MTSLEKCRAVFFDFDGVLFDSEPLHYEAWKEAVHAFGYTDKQFLLKDVVGMSDETIAKRFQEAMQMSQKDLCKAKDEKFFQIIERGSFHTKEEKELLEALQGRFYLAVVSSSSERTIRSLLRKGGLEKFFPLIVSSDHVRRHKPDPMPYEYALTEAGFRRDEVIAIEDSAPGVESASKAGLTVVWFNRYAAPAITTKTAWVCTRIRDLKALFCNF